VMWPASMPMSAAPADVCWSAAKVQQTSAGAPLISIDAGHVAAADVLTNREIPHSTRTHIHTHTYINAHIHAHIRVYIDTNTCTYTQNITNTYTHACMLACVHACGPIGTRDPLKRNTQAS
jgi:hypothetical protein